MSLVIESIVMITQTFSLKSVRRRANPMKIRQELIKLSVICYLNQIFLNVRSEYLKKYNIY
jgi:hypothetical protein